jgi:hypothetical protein
MLDKSLVGTIRDFIKSYESEAIAGWPKDASGALTKSKYDGKNKKLAALWNGLINKIELECEVKNNGDPYTIKPAKVGNFPGSNGHRVILYFYHKERGVSGRSGIYCALFLNTNSSRDYEFKLALTQGREVLEKKEGDSDKARDILIDKSLEIARKYHNDFKTYGFTTAVDTRGQGIEIATKEYSGKISESGLVEDLNNLLKIDVSLVKNVVKEEESGSTTSDMNVPDRKDIIVSRIIRDTKVSLEVKELYNFECQLCGLTLNMPNGKRYVEAHHIQPLGKPHDGPDVIENMICVCPNHHAELDYGAIQLDLKKITMKSDRKIASEYVKYHNENLFKP